VSAVGLPRVITEAFVRERDDGGTRCYEISREGLFVAVETSYHGVEHRRGIEAVEVERIAGTCATSAMKLSCARPLPSRNARRALSSRGNAPSRQRSWARFYPSDSVVPSTIRRRASVRDDVLEIVKRCWYLW